MRRRLQSPLFPYLNGIVVSVVIHGMSVLRFAVSLLALNTSILNSQYHDISLKRNVISQNYSNLEDAFAFELVISVLKIIMSEHETVMFVYEVIIQVPVLSCQSLRSATLFLKVSYQKSYLLQALAIVLSVLVAATPVD